MPELFTQKYQILLSLDLDPLFPKLPTVMYDLISKNWYRALVDHASASYSSLGVPALSNRPPNTTYGELAVIQDQIYLVGVGSEENWSLNVRHQFSYLSNSSYTCSACGIGEGSPGAAGQCSKFGNNNALAECTSCPAGYSSASGGASNCTDCYVGSYNLAGSSFCDSCPVGKFADVDALSVCLDCPDGYTTTGSGSSHISNCSTLSECSVGRYSTSSDGKCLRIKPPSMIWTTIITNSNFTSNSLRFGIHGITIGSKTQPLGYLFGGNDSSGLSQRIYSFSADFSSVVSLSSCMLWD
jgi:hypothetical protein